MPTPIGHALAGFALAGVSGGRRLPNAHLVILAFCAAAPDLDLLLRLVDGTNHHRGPSHSFTAALLVGIAGSILRRLGAPLPGGVSMGAAWASHVVLDYLGLDTSPPIGEMALWPFSSGFFASPVPLFYDVPRVITWVATGHNALAVLIELLVLVPIVVFCWRGGIPKRRGAPDRITRFVE